MSKIFLSWSGEKSQRIADFLYSWLPSVLQFAEPYFSPEDIEKGKKWSSDVSSALSDTDFGIICLTKDNIDKPWILFEAGALSKNISKANVCTLLVDLQPADVSGPLAQFQHTTVSETDIKKMMSAINTSNAGRLLGVETFNSVFTKWWPELLDRVNEINSEVIVDKEDSRSDRSILEEVLITVRRIDGEKEHRNSSDSQVSIWSTENIQILERMWVDGFSAQSISKELGVSVNSIIGKVHRLGFERSEKSKLSSISIGSEVFHAKFGDGVVVKIHPEDQDIIFVEFDVGVKQVVSSYISLK